MLKLARVKTAVRTAFPEHSLVARLLRRTASRFGLAQEYDWAVAYQDYQRLVEPGVFRSPLPVDGGAPLFSLVVPFFNTPEEYLSPLLDSVLAQTFPGWELVLADASTDPARAAAIARVARRDPRLRYLRLPDNGGISANTNAGLGQATGEYLVFCDHDDTLSPHALNEIAWVLREEPLTDILYSDEDMLADNGRYRSRPAFKPAWSPHQFLQTNYTNHLSVVRRSLVEEVGGLRPEFDGSQDYDLLLRLHTLGRRVTVAHVPKVLYHWREARGSTALAVTAKPYAVDAGRRALAEALDRMGCEVAQVADLPGLPGMYRPVLRRACTVEVLIVADDANGGRDLARAVQAATETEAVSARFTALADDELARALEEGTSEVVVVLRDPFLPDSPDWLDDLAGVLSIPGTRAVAPLLTDADGRRVLDAGLVREAGPARGARLLPLYAGARVDGVGLAGLVGLTRDVDGLAVRVLAFDRGRVGPADLRRGIVEGDDGGCPVVWPHVRFRAVGEADVAVTGELTMSPVGASRFNPNLVVEGSTVAFAGLRAGAGE